MKKIQKMLALTLCLATMGTAAAACATPSTGTDTIYTEKVDNKRTQLYVFSYGGGFGSEWLRAAKTRYEALHANDEYEPGTDKKGVQIMIDHRKVALTSADIKTSQDDVFFTEGVNYYQLYRDGALLDLTDTLEKPLNDIDADDNQSVLDKFFPEQTNFYNVNYGTAKEAKYYAVPHYAAYYGLTYNVDLFDQEGYYFAADKSYYEESGFIEDLFIAEYNTGKTVGPDGEAGTSDDGLPTTYEEFFILCDYIASTGALPMRWTGSNYKDYLNSFMNSLIVDYEGKANMMMNYTFNGVAKNLGRIQDGEFVYDTTPTPISEDNWYELSRTDSRYYALKFLETLCKDSTQNNKYHNSEAFKTSYSHMDAQSDFLWAGKDGVTKKTAMLVDGDWWQMEAVSTFTTMVQQKGEEMSEKNRRFAFMPLPKANATKAAEAANSAVKSTLYNAQDSAGFIKSTIADYKKDLALDFLRFVNTQESLVEYTQVTSTTKALNYSLSATEKAACTHFGRSIIEMQEKSEIVYPMANNQFYIDNMSTFRPAQMYNSTILHQNHQWAAQAFRDFGTLAETYFSGMETFNRNKWSTLQ